MDANKPMPLLTAVLLLFFNTSAYSQTYQSSLDIGFLGLPDPVIIDGKQNSYYELLLTNFSIDSITLNSVDVLENSTNSLLKLTGAGLVDQFQLIGAKQKSTESILPPGNAAIIYMEVSWPKSQNPVRFSHRLEINKNKNAILTEGGVIRLPAKKSLVIGAPLDSGAWAAVYDPVWERGHRRVIYTVDGKAHIPGRFAIDFIKLDDEGSVANGDENTVANWYGYGMNVIAVADGTVQSVQDIYPESKTLSDHPPHSPDRATGNYIALDIGNDRIVFYEHLKPNSIKVNIGQKVKKGDRIASVGFTGQSTGPHLHVHVADKNSPLGAEGVPFAFESFIQLGRYPDFSRFGKQRWISDESPGSIRRNERPGPNTVVDFKRK